MNFIGIDPGKSGALACIDEVGRICSIFDYPAEGISELIGIMQEEIDFPTQQYRAAIEHVHSMSSQGIASAFTFGKNVGIWHGVLASHAIPFIEVSPQKWQKAFGFKKSDGQKPSIAVASQLFPEAVLRGPRGGKRDGRADALLIAEWLRRQERGNVR